MLVRLDNHDDVTGKRRDELYSRVQLEDMPGTEVMLRKGHFHPSIEYPVEVYRHNGDFLGYVNGKEHAKRIFLALFDNEQVQATFNKIEDNYYSTCVIDVKGAPTLYKRKSMGRNDMPLEPIDFVAIDFETATMDKCSPCSIGIAIVKNGEITDACDYLIKPHETQRPFEPKFIKLHGINEQMVRDEPEFDKVWEKIQTLIMDTPVIVAHNVYFDAEVLHQTLNLYDIQLPRILVTLCSLSVSRRTWPHLQSHKLSEVAKI